MKISHLIGHIFAGFGLNSSWPVGAGILSFMFLILNVTDQIHSFDEQSRILLSYLIPSVTIPFLAILHLVGYYWQLPRLVEKFPDKDFTGANQRIGIYIIYDTMAVLGGLSFGMLGIWAPVFDVKLSLMITALLYPVTCSIVGRAFVREGIGYWIVSKIKSQA
jgi:hypothetical protein